MFNVVEIDKTSAYSGDFTPYSPFVYQSTVSIASVSIYYLKF
jgi:hypothetical protein